MSDIPQPARRQLLTGAASLLTLPLLGAGARAQAPVKPATAEDTAMMAPGPLPDIIVGQADAACTIVEYASMTCPHCAAFHTDVFPLLKAKYIDTGKVRFILREFPLDPLAAAAFMVARCAGADKRTPLVDLLFTTQKTWAYSEKPAEALLDVVKQAGFSKESFDKCLTDQKLYADVLEMRARGGDKFGVNATPAFFVNGKRLESGLTAEGMDAALKPYVN